MNEGYEWWSDDLIVLIFWTVMAALGLGFGAVLGSLV
jgi:hypothetical protein